MGTWQEFTTADGDVYYYNSQTGETSWDRPAELEDTGSSEKFYFIPHPEHAYLPGTLAHEYFDGSFLARGLDGTEWEVKVAKGKNFQQVAKPIEKKSLLTTLMDDLVKMEVVNDPFIIHNLRERAKTDNIYTSVGDILISINPYKTLPIYTTSVMDQYWHGDPLKLPPHMFTIANDCYRNIIDGKANQSCLISGESGAGKTEATKILLQFLAEIAGSDTGVEQSMLLANPILEAFGNAKTVRNNNSSRFGKWMEVHFDSHKKIIGCTVINYLLEKSRVAMQNPGERNFHSFYQLTAGAPADWKTTFGLQTADDYAYTNQSGCCTIDGVDDHEEFQDTVNAMRRLEFSEDDIFNVWRVTAAILHIGNLDFVPNKDGSNIKDEQLLETVAYLLEVPSFLLKESLIQRKFQGAGRSTTYNIPLPPPKAQDGRDSLAQTLYGALFQFVVDHIQGFLKRNIGSTQTQVVGVLDIFGFEIFEKNSFEQLCINFANEKLQQHFNAHTFKKEEAVYQSEQIKFQHVEFIDNQIVLDLMEKKPQGLISMLDEEIVVPKGTDETFLQKVKNTFKGHERVDPMLRSPLEFGIIHYAGHVVYSVQGFLDKNKDICYDGLLQTLQMSENALVAQLMSAITGDSSGGGGGGGGGGGAGGAPRGRGRGAPAGGAPRGRGRGKAPPGGAGGPPAAGGAPGGAPKAKSKKVSLATQFKDQLNALMDTLNTTEPHYVRCIKPNPNKRPSSEELHGDMVMKQLTYSGVFEAVTIRKTGYPFRKKHEDFFKRYRCLYPKTPGSNYKDLCVNLLKSIAEQKNVSDVQVGKSLILYKAAQHRDLELIRNVVVERAVITLQAWNRGWRTRILTKKLKEMRKVLLSAIATRDLDTILAAIEKSDDLDFELYDAVRAKQLRDLILEERRVLVMLKEAISLVQNATDPPKGHLDKLREAVDRANAINYQCPEAQQARDQFKVISDRIEARKQIDEAVANADEAALDAALAFAQSISLPTNDPSYVAGLAEKERLTQENQVIDNLMYSLSISAEGPIVAIDEVGEVTLTDEIVRHLIDSIAHAESFGCRTNQGKVLVATSKVVANLRDAIAADNWDKVDQILVEANAGLHNKTLAEAPEIQAAHDQLIHRAKQAEVQEKLDEFAQSFNAAALALEIDKATNLRMEVQYYQDLLQYIYQTMDSLSAALTAVEQEKLEEAIAMAEQINYNLEDYYQAVEMRDTIIKYAKEMEDSFVYMESFEQMEELYGRVTKLGMHTEAVTHMQELLSLSPEAFKKAQMKCAVALKDRERMINLSIELKEMFFANFANSFVLEQCSAVKTPSEFAKGKIIGKEKTKQNMFNWDKHPIHTSLTRLSHNDEIMLKQLKKDAVIIFKNLLGYMGDRALSFPETLARENVVKGIQSPEIRDEIYFQIIKQLNNNPSPESRQKGWKMMDYCLQSFPPSVEFENFLEVWLRKQNRVELRGLLHEVIFTGAKTQPPSNIT